MRATMRRRERGPSTLGGLGRGPSVVGVMAGNRRGSARPFEGTAGKGCRNGAPQRVGGTLCGEEVHRLDSRGSGSGCLAIQRPSARQPWLKASRRRWTWYNCRTGHREGARGCWPAGSAVSMRLVLADLPALCCRRHPSLPPAASRRAGSGSARSKTCLPRRTARTATAATQLAAHLAAGSSRPAAAASASTAAPLVTTRRLARTSSKFGHLHTCNSHTCTATLFRSVCWCDSWLIIARSPQQCSSAEEGAGRGCTQGGAGGQGLRAAAPLQPAT